MEKTIWDLTEIESKKALDFVLKKIAKCDGGSFHHYSNNKEYFDSKTLKWKTIRRYDFFHFDRFKKELEEHIKLVTPLSLYYDL